MTTTQGARPDHGTGAHSPTTDEYIPTEEQFWKSRDMLQHVHDFARARMTTPWAVLGVVLARVVTATEPWVVLPKIVGGHGSLNLFIGLVGASGTGKGAATAAGQDAVSIPGGVFSVNVGSGEGLAHTFVKREKGQLVPLDNDSALIQIPEIDSLTSLSTRSSATILPELRKAWSGEDLGFAYGFSGDAQDLLDIGSGSTGDRMRVTIKSSDKGFETKGCGIWRKI